MTATQDILRVGVVAQATGLLGENIALAKKQKKTTGDFVKLGAKNIVGTELLKAQSQIIGGL